MLVAVVIAVLYTTGAAEYVVNVLRHILYEAVFGGVMKRKGWVLVVLGAIVAAIVAFCKWAYELGTSGMRSK